MSKILAIDDKKDNLISISALLNALIPDCEILTAQSGFEGLSKAVQEAPDSILLDIKMPGMDGYEVCRRLKANKDTRHIPVIMISGIRTGSQDLVRGLSCGADAYLAKPIDEYVLAAQVNTALRIKNAEDCLRNQKTHLETLVQERTRELQISERRLAIKNRIAKAFLATPDERIYPHILRIVLEVMQSRYGIFGHINENGALVGRTMALDSREQERFPDEQIVFSREQWCGIWGRAMRERQTFYANEPFHVPRGHLPITSALDVPLIHNGELIGNFLVGNKDGDYDDHDRRLLENICEYIGPVLYARRERDVQQKKSRELESHLRQAQKMQSIGTLASGIAHDFNNILSSIMGYTSLAMEEVKKGTSLYDNLSEVQSAGNRAARLVQQILTISRPGEQEMESISIAPLIKETLKMVRSTIPSSIELKPYICSEPLIVRADATQLHQVLLNLVTNAGQSMVDENGVLEIRLEAVHCDAECGHRCPGMSPGDYACITVSDTGQGIDAAHLDRIFEPYFTTREKGEGTGLGLFVVHGIVQSLKGCITVDSEIGQGTTFRVCLPLMQEATRLAPPSAVEKTVPAGKESILVVDDELPIVNMLQQTFERQGYQVIAKTSSIEAMVTFRALPDRFDLVVTDMTMPYMSGEKLARTIKEIRPDVPVILCTGFSKKINRQPLPPEIDGFLMKPVDPVKISRMVRDMLDLKNGKIENGKP